MRETLAQPGNPTLPQEFRVAMLLLSLSHPLPGAAGGWGGVTVGSEGSTGQDGKTGGIPRKGR